MKGTIGIVFAAMLLGGAALAQDRGPQDALKARLESVEQALATLEQKVTVRMSGMMEGCRGMMSDGMASSGMMRGAERPSPNEQWRDKD